MKGKIFIVICCFFSFSSFSILQSITALLQEITTELDQHMDNYVTIKIYNYAEEDGELLLSGYTQKKYYASNLYQTNYFIANHIVKAKQGNKISTAKVLKY